MQEIISSLLESIDFGAIIITILTGVFTWLGKKIKTIYDEKVKNETIRNVVSDCVKYVEQKAKTEEVQNKFSLAKEKVTNILASKNINISDDEIDVLIESFVNSLKE